MQATASASVLGITDFGPVAGTPLVPPSYLTVYFVLFLALLSALYVYFYHKKRPVLLWHKLRLLVALAIFIKLVVVLGTVLVVAYWLVPTPGIRRTIPEALISSFPPTDRVEIVFDRPVSRKEIRESISPEIPGRWVFENSIYTTHLYRNLVFYPTFSFRSGTTYIIKISGIRNFIKISPPTEYQFKFTTQASPKVQKVTPVNNQNKVATDSEINITLDSPNENISEFNFYLDPKTTFDTVLDSSKMVYTLKPKVPLKQGTSYSLKITKHDVILNLTDGTVSERSQAEDYNSTFTTIEAPGINSFAPNYNNVPVDSEIVIDFTKEMDKKSVENSFSIKPAAAGSITWPTDQTLSYKPAKLAFETEYSVTLAKGARSLDGGSLEQDLVKTFKTIGPVIVSTFDPQNGLTAINIRSPVKVTFDQEVDHESAESKFSITPKINGHIVWSGNTMSFIPAEPLSFTTNYVAAIDEGIKSVHGTSSREKFQTQFTTQNANIKLAVPAYLQKYTLSCEIAALRMALNFRGANVTEDDLIPKVGFDTTPHNGNIWGNPYNAFVGNIRGTQMKDGYGVYWGPIARAARDYRGAQEFQNWNISDLTAQISKGNPVVIWVYSHFGTPTSWNTPDGTNIYAVRDEHAVVAVGFTGTSDNPTQLIINDPLSGQVYWSRSVFDKKWNIFANSGVVIF